MWHGGKKIYLARRRRLQLDGADGGGSGALVHAAAHDPRPSAASVVRQGRHSGDQRGLLHRGAQRGACMNFKSRFDVLARHAVAVVLARGCEAVCAHELGEQICEVLPQIGVKGRESV